MTTFSTFRGLRGIAAGILLTGAASPSLAENSWYFGLEYDRVFLKDSQGTVFVPESQPADTCLALVGIDPNGANCRTDGPGTFANSETTFEDDNGYGISVGYDFEGLLRVDLIAKRMRNRVETVNDNPTDGDITSTSLLANLWFDFNRDGIVQPYAGFGLGASEIDYADREDTVLMGQVGLGVNFHLSDVVVIDLGARYFQTKDPDFDSFTEEYEGANAVLGLRFNFPGEPEPTPETTDTDGDGVPDARDRCPGTPVGTPVNAEGCADSDGDGVIDTRDLCPGTPPGTPVDATGCSDLDGDGISDRIDACPSSPAGEAVMSNGCAAEQSLVLEGVNFEVNSSRLTVNAQRLLDRVATSLIDSPTFQVEVQGHTDNTGPDAYNLILSQDRANAVKAYLTGKGVEPERIAARGYGERQPLADNSTKEGRTQNRRVEMKVLGEQ